MVNQEHLDILKQSVEAWNQWRKEHDYFELFGDIYNIPDLSEADLSEADLSKADLHDALLYKANLSKANLSKADLTAANLSFANFNNADLSDADLSEASLERTDLSRANLSRANLSRANLSDADLSGANLSGANLNRADLSGATFSGTSMGSPPFLTTFGDVDLSVAKGLETVQHKGPSTIGIDTIINSQGKIPESFLQGAGIPPSIIEAIPSLIGSLEPIQYYTCFISYSSKDQNFAERLYADLQAKGVRCWFALENMDIGDKIRPRIEESIRAYDKLLLVLSEHSIASNWVAYEVERALNKEPQGKPNILFPICIDDAVMQSKASWVDDIKSTRHIGDFTNWKNHDNYQKAFDRLLRALKAEAQKMEMRDGTTNDG